jgi:hypothetical protein
MIPRRGPRATGPDVWTFAYNCRIALDKRFSSKVRTRFTAADHEHLADADQIVGRIHDIVIRRAVFRPRSDKDRHSPSEGTVFVQISLTSQRKDK